MLKKSAFIFLSIVSLLQAHNDEYDALF